MLDLAGSEHSSNAEEELAPEDMDLDIRVHLNREVHFVGQEIEGYVVVKNPVRRRMRGIRLTLRCRAEVVWDSPATKKLFLARSKGEEGSRCRNDHDLLYEEKYVVGTGKTMILEAGDHQYQFTIAIKDKHGKVDLPSSMEFPQGCIRYYLKAEVDWPWAVIRGHDKVISVLDMCDLRSIRESMQPATFTKAFKTGSGFSNKKVHVAGRLEKIGYVPGEEVLLHIEIDNKSPIRIPRFFLKIVEVVRYVSSDGRISETRYDLATVEKGEVAPNSEVVLEKEGILIPPVPQSHSTHVDFLKLTYEVSLEVQIGNELKRVSNPIKVGSLPTLQAYKRFESCRPPTDSLCVLPGPKESRKGVPVPEIKKSPLNPDINMAAVLSIDPDFGGLWYPWFRFDKETAIRTFDDDDEEDEEVVGERMSEFSM